MSPMPAENRPSQEAYKLSWPMAITIGLLAVSVFLNYIDRGNLAIAAPKIALELDLSLKQLGVLFSAFFWTYTFFQILSGWLVDRFNVNWILAGGFFVWTVATAATGYAHSFWMLLALRLVLGAGESVAFPSYGKIMAKYCSEVMRGRANGFVMSGIAAGPAFGTFIGAMLMDRYGWRPFFVALGLLSLLWLPPWLKWMPEGPGCSAHANGQTASILDILQQRSAWGSFAGLFAYNYFSYFLLTWLPFYLTHERNFSMKKMGTIGGLAYLILAASSIVSGWIADRWILAGGTPTLVRKTFTVMGLFIGSCACLALALLDSSPALATSFLFVLCVGAGMFTSCLWTITQRIAGPLAAGKWIGVQNFAGNFAGLVSPALTGYVVDRTGHFFWAFAVTAGVMLAGAFSLAFIVGPVEPLKWRNPELQATQENQIPSV